MTFKLKFTAEAESALNTLRADTGLEKRRKAVEKALGYLQTNPRHPGLQTHKNDDATGPGGEEGFEAYAENNTPAAYRIFWCYGPDKGFITILSIVPHP